MTDSYEIFELGDVVLQCSITLRGAKLAYKTYGMLSPARDNAILMPTFFGAQHSDVAAMIRPGRALDPEKYFIVVPNLFGNGLTADAAFSEGWYESPPVKGLRACSRVYAGWYLSQDFFREQEYRKLGLASLEDTMRFAEDYFRRRDANDLLAMLSTWLVPLPRRDAGAQSACDGRRGPGQLLRRAPESGEFVLFLHGFPQFADAWAELLETVGAWNYHAVALDRRGYSPDARPVSVDDYGVDELSSDAWPLRIFSEQEGFTS